MSYKLLNETKKDLDLSTLPEAVREDVEALKQGEYTLCPGWEQVDAVLSCFPAEVTEEWHIEEAGTIQHGKKMFAICPDGYTVTESGKKERRTSARFYNEYKKMLAGELIIKKEK